MSDTMVKSNLRHAHVLILAIILLCVMFSVALIGNTAVQEECFSVPSYTEIPFPVLTYLSDFFIKYLPTLKSTNHAIKINA